MTHTVYLNGEFCAVENAHVSVDDRAFTFADGIYEGLLYANGAIFEEQAHFDRLAQSANACKLTLPFDVAELNTAMLALIERNKLNNSVAFIYLQVTRGVAPRNHPFPASTPQPTVYAFVREIAPKPEWQTGASALLVPETRGSLCFIKSTALLPNILARQAAAEAGASEAVFVRDNTLMEGSHSNFFAVVNGVLHTHPANEFILNGITRKWLIAACDELNISLSETPVMLSQLNEIEEAFFSGTTTMVTPIHTLLVSDDVAKNTQAVTLPVGDITKKLQAALFAASGLE